MNSIRNDEDMLDIVKQQREHLENAEHVSQRASIWSFRALTYVL